MSILPWGWWRIIRILRLYWSLFIQRLWFCNLLFFAIRFLIFRQCPSRISRLWFIHIWSLFIFLIIFFCQFIILFLLIAHIWCLFGRLTLIFRKILNRHCVSFWILILSVLFIVRWLALISILIFSIITYTLLWLIINFLTLLGWLFWLAISKSIERWIFSICKFILISFILFLIFIWSKLFLSCAFFFIILILSFNLFLCKLRFYNWRWRRGFSRRSTIFINNCVWTLIFILSRILRSFFLFFICWIYLFYRIFRIFRLFFFSIFIF